MSTFKLCASKDILKKAKIPQKGRKYWQIVDAIRNGGVTENSRNAKAKRQRFSFLEAEEGI